MTDNGWTGGGATALGTYAPRVLDSYEVLVSVRPFGVHDEMLEAPVVTAFAEQFGRDASAIDEPLRAEFVRVTEGHATAVAQMVWISDVAPRIRTALDALFGRSAQWPSRRRYPVADTGVSIDVFLESAAAAAAAEHDPSGGGPDAANAALALADAMAGTPAAIPDSVVRAVHELLGPGEAVAVVLDGARRSVAKIDTARVA